jgi:hypothetical protein
MYGIWKARAENPAPRTAALRGAMIDDKLRRLKMYRKEVRREKWMLRLDGYPRLYSFLRGELSDFH